MGEIRRQTLQFEAVKQSLPGLRTALRAASSESLSFKERCEAFQFQATLQF
jgi:hypothetical protein